MLEEANTALPRAYGHTRTIDQICIPSLPASDVRRSEAFGAKSSGDSPGRIIGPVGRIIKALMLAPFVSQTMPAFVAKARTARTPANPERTDRSRERHLDRTYSLSDTAEAIRYVESGHARGKVVVVVDTA